jgi:hypothetical protein
MTDTDDPRDSNPLLDLSSSRRGIRSPIAVCERHHEFMAEIRAEFADMKADNLETRKEGLQTRAELGAMRTTFEAARITMVRLATGKQLTEDDLTPPGRNAPSKTLKSNAAELAIGPVKYRGRATIVWAALGALVVIAVIGGVAWVEGARASHVTATVAQPK